MRSSNLANSGMRTAHTPAPTSPNVAYTILGALCTWKLKTYPLFIWVPYFMREQCTVPSGDRTMSAAEMWSIWNVDRDGLEVAIEATMMVAWVSEGEFELGVVPGKAARKGCV